MAIPVTLASFPGPPEHLLSFSGNTMTKKFVMQLFRVEEYVYLYEAYFQVCKWALDERGFEVDEMFLL